MSRALRLLFSLVIRSFRSRRDGTMSDQIARMIWEPVHIRRIGLSNGFSTDGNDSVFGQRPSAELLPEVWCLAKARHGSISNERHSLSLSDFKFLQEMSAAETQFELFYCVQI
jgi:hypothetical protein